MSRSGSADGVLRSLESHGVAVGALEPYTACDPRVTADEDGTTQVVENVSGPEQDYDGAKRMAGKKCHLPMDTNRLVLGRVQR